MKRLGFPLYRLGQPLPTYLLKSVAVVGGFDGCHRGHQQIIDLANRSGPVVMVCFYPLPRIALQADAKMISSLREQLWYIAHYQVAAVLMIPFGQRVQMWSAETFVETVLVNQLQVNHVVVGSDFYFGKQRQGNIQLLTELGHLYGFQVSISPDYCDQYGKLSSTRIKAHLQKGELGRAEQVLGHRYITIGKVQYGEGRGQKLGFPTANIRCRLQQIVLSGVFAAYVFVHDRWWPAVINVGTRPTFSGTTIWIEVHLLGFSANLYGQTIIIHWLEKIRDERRFDGIEALCQQIDADVWQAKQICAKSLSETRN